MNDYLPQIATATATKTETETETEKKPTTRVALY